MIHDKPDFRPTIAAAIVACILMLLFGLTHRFLSARMSTFTNMPPLDPAVLQALPQQIGNWTGQDVPVKDAIIRAANTDAYINRRFRRQNRNALESVSLFIGCGTDIDKVMSHRPLGCYKYAGWALTSQRSMKLPLGNGTRLPCIVYEFYRDGPAAETVTVLHYCHANGRYFDEVMQVRALGLAGMRSVRYAAQVQIIASKPGLPDDSAMQIISDFAVDSAEPIARLLGAIDREQAVIQSGNPTQGK